MTHSGYAARTFGLDLSPPDPPAPPNLPMPGKGECLAVIGPSGSGKTLALQSLLQRNNDAREVTRLRCEDLDSAVLDLFPVDVSSDAVLRTLARVGLADGRLWALKAGQLSAGECRRLEIALAMMHSGPLVIDEFDAHLDATTSRLLAQNLHRLCADRGLVVTTHRPESLRYLRPTRVVEIDRGVYERNAPPAGDMLKEIEFVRGRKRDYDAFAQWHYLGPGRAGPCSDVWLAKHHGRDVAIVMFGYPHLFLGARSHVLPEFAPVRIHESGAAGLNETVRLLQRVVVEPRWRGIGLARALIRHGLKHIDVSTVECVAQMGAFSGFLTGSGFRRVGEIKPPKSVRLLVEFMKRHAITERQLIDARTRAQLLDSLNERIRRKLRTRLLGVVRTRIQTGCGSLRGRIEMREDVLRKALSRLHAQPVYFLWRRQ